MKTLISSERDYYFQIKYCYNVEEGLHIRFNNPGIFLEITNILEILEIRSIFWMIQRKFWGDFSVFDNSKIIKNSLEQYRNNL